MDDSGGDGDKNAKPATTFTPGRRLKVPLNGSALTMYRKTTYFDNSFSGCEENAKDGDDDGDDDDCIWRECYDRRGPFMFRPSKRYDIHFLFKGLLFRSRRDFSSIGYEEQERSVKRVYRPDERIDKSSVYPTDLAKQTRHGHINWNTGNVGNLGRHILANLHSVTDFSDGMSESVALLRSTVDELEVMAHEYEKLRAERHVRDIRLLSLLRRREAAGNTQTPFTILPSGQVLLHSGFRVPEIPLTDDSWGIVFSMISQTDARSLGAVSKELSILYRLRVIRLTLTMYDSPRPIFPDGSKNDIPWLRLPSVGWIHVENARKCVRDSAAVPKTRNTFPSIPMEILKTRLLYCNHTMVTLVFHENHAGKNETELVDFDFWLKEYPIFFKRSGRGHNETWPDNMVFNSMFYAIHAMGRILAFFARTLTTDGLSVPFHERTKDFMVPPIVFDRIMSTWMPNANHHEVDRIIESIKRLGTEFRAHDEILNDYVKNWKNIDADSIGHHSMDRFAINRWVTVSCRVPCRILSQQDLSKFRTHGTRRIDRVNQDSRDQLSISLDEYRAWQRVVLTFLVNIPIRVGDVSNSNIYAYGQLPLNYSPVEIFDESENVLIPEENPEKVLTVDYEEVHECRALTTDIMTLDQRPYPEVIN